MEGARVQEWRRSLFTRRVFHFRHTDPKSMTGFEPATYRAPKYPLPAHRAPTMSCASRDQVGRGMDSLREK